jgi:hypothetical protein
MARTLRVDFAHAPATILKQLFGEAKQATAIVESLTHFDGYAHEKEIFHYLNTDTQNEWVIVKDKDGKPTVHVTFQNLRQQLATMVKTGQIKKWGGERAATYALLDHEGEVPEEVEGDEDETTADAE